MKKIIILALLSFGFLFQSMAPGPKPIKKTPTPSKTQYTGAIEQLERTGGRQMVKSEEMQEQAVKIISEKYSMKNASFITIKSFSGPRPPNGGYIYWGVKGNINGKCHVWQPGYGLRQRTGLEDPKKFQK